ncbi:putative Dol-P-Glc:Glc(2)Man(9)GlcNAc(2)-PP-Dol alpha-1,2-glucosyltransferase [Ixodes scapularis]|uniref:putative Dol-P-Glc:Glc(2)Man(9)GlcNAc(2)-PP-Dol alpha-1,2-glucosyltransferase n=1 Tax=Ixodes scapularis TaxID=6945 RepID=UPI001AD71E65|nr:putative Dol-P-Glc:Glc(2)Man(9)GlcNAc(2)-PP-Dol alpha-1,2-glucosyltransferase [Ixodes scapularis]
MRLLLFVVVFIALFLSSLLVSVVVNHAQPAPYMDEIFHVPQAQSYCSYNFTYWDPKITTPPGLYLTSLCFGLAAKLLVAADLCTPFYLRCTNILLMLGNFCASSAIMIRLAGACDGSTRAKLILASAATTLLPVLHFFTFLFYTDPGTVLFLQLMYLYSLFEHHWLAATFGAVAVLYRQTSIVWVFMVAACKVMAVADDRWPVDKWLKLENISCTVAQLASDPHKRVREAFDFVRDVLRDCVGYVIVGAAFVAFLVYNGGIVLGDKSAHQACFHVPQLGYFLLFSAFSGAPFFLQPNILSDFCCSLRRRAYLYAILVLASVLTVQNFSHIHPYLLADNRHLTFYLWRKVLGRSELIRFCLVPICIYAGYAMLHQLRHTSRTWRLFFLVGVFASVVPQKLLEFRYFIFPYLFFRLHLKGVTYRQIFLELMLHVTVNVAVMHLFLNKTFMWESDPSSVQRFMW